MLAPLATASAEAFQAAWNALAPTSAHGVQRVECAMGDFSSLARGKTVSSADFIAAQGCKLPTVLLGMGVTGGAPAEVFGPLLPQAYGDMQLVPDLGTLALRPNRPHEATVICEPVGRWWSPALSREVDACEFSPRAALRHVLAAYAQRGLQARVAPELELFLLQRQATTGEHQMGSAVAQFGSSARESACEQYSLERTTQFQAYFDALYAGAQALGIPLSGHLHEAAFSQYEINFFPGEPLAMADAVFRFKRLARELAVQHGFLASFAAKPFLDQPGTGMHWHFSVQRPQAAWPAVFAHADGSSTPALSHFIAGVQREAAAAMALFAPYDMAFDRIRLSDASPTHASWGHEDRHAALRIPTSGPAARRVENRLPGGDANPYLTVAATLALGLAGLDAQATPSAPGEPAPPLPQSLPAALDALAHNQVLREWLGAPLLDLYTALKRQEHAERNALPDPRTQWDLKHLIELA